MTNTDPFQHPTYPFPEQPIEEDDVAMPFIASYPDEADVDPVVDVSQPGWHDISEEGRDWQEPMGTALNANVSDSSYCGENLNGS